MFNDPRIQDKLKHVSVIPTQIYFNYLILYTAIKDNGVINLNLCEKKWKNRKTSRKVSCTNLNSWTSELFFLFAYAFFPLIRLCSSRELATAVVTEYHCSELRKFLPRCSTKYCTISLLYSFGANI